MINNIKDDTTYDTISVVTLISVFAKSIYYTDENAWTPNGVSLGYEKTQLGIYTRVYDRTLQNKQLTLTVLVVSLSYNLIQNKTMMFEVLTVSSGT